MASERVAPRLEIVSRHKDGSRITSYVRLDKQGPITFSFAGLCEDESFVKPGGLAELITSQRWQTAAPNFSMSVMVMLAFRHPVERRRIYFPVIRYSRDHPRHPGCLSFPDGPVYRDDDHLGVSALHALRERTGFDSPGIKVTGVLAHIEGVPTSSSHHVTVVVAMKVDRRESCEELQKLLIPQNDQVSSISFMTLEKIRASRFKCTPDLKKVLDGFSISDFNMFHRKI